MEVVPSTSELSISCFSISSISCLSASSNSCLSESKNSCLSESNNCCLSLPSQSTSSFSELLPSGLSDSCSCSISSNSASESVAALLRFFLTFTGFRFLPLLFFDPFGRPLGRFGWSASSSSYTLAFAIPPGFLPGGFFTPGRLHLFL